MADLTLEKIIDYLDERTEGIADYIVERGQKGIWHYEIWKSGWAECWAWRVVQGLNITQAWGSMYYGTVPAPENYPFTFSEYPVVDMTLQVTNGNGVAAWNNTSYTMSNPGNLFVVNPTSISGMNLTVNYRAKGRLTPGTTTLRVMTYNVGMYDYGNQPEGIAPDVYQRKLAELQRFISFSGADVLALQENTDYIDRAQTISTDTALYNTFYPYSETLPLSGIQQTTLKSKIQPTATNSGRFTASNRTYTIMDLPVNGKTLRVLNLHLHPSDYELQKADLREAITLASGTDYSILAGDFNVGTFEDPTAHRDEFWGIATAAGYQLSNGGPGGWVPTWHGNGPTWFIDNVLVKGNATVKANSVPSVYNDLVSDHLPNIATIEFR